MNPEEKAAPDLLLQYRDYGAKCEANLKESFDKHDALHRASAELIDQLAAWVSELSHRPEHGMLETAVRELRFGLLACAEGQYRQAYMALRMTLELSAAAIHYSVREVELREWEDGRVLIKWSILTDKDGVFSDRFTQACAPTLIDIGSQMKGLAITAYKECSDFVHGAAKSATLLPDDLSFNEDVLNRWHAHLRIVVSPIVFLILARHARYSDVVTTPAAVAIVSAVLGGVAPAMSLVTEKGPADE